MVGVTFAVAFAGVAALGVPAASAAPAQSERRDEALVSISAPTDLDRGDKAAIGVTVRDLETGDAIEGVRIVLQRRSFGESGWAEADRTVTDAAGRAILQGAVRPPATEFRARMPRTDDYRSARSAPVIVTAN